MNGIEFYELARASHIKRWHIVNTAKEQNLAEHHYNVVVIALELRRGLRDDPPSLHFVMSALFHDVAEIRYGDIPTPGKRFLHDQFNVDFKALDRMIVPELPYTKEPVFSDELTSMEEAEYEDALIKLADLIEAAWWIKENGLGHHASVVADKCWRLVVEKVAELRCYDAANHVLTNLGMPYISPASQVNQL